ncbi:TlpA disulfide reductase family protein [Rugosimonospora africana]|uniref:TlpA disulfide reductase family protein n=1 Tax=Rugosimonospora africana TaxID=556532 RepID=UPI0019411A40|nr:TlpA disulfide reductase family protein [Rugosimonospora africana]
MNLVLSVGVIKRLREHTALLSATGVPSQPALTIGDAVDAFATTTVNGESVSYEDVTAETLVGFFTPGCGPCEKRLPEFVAYARTLPGGRDRVLATVVASDPAEAAGYVAELGQVARVVLEDSTGVATRAFRVSAYPTVLMVAPDPDGRVLVTADRIRLDRAVVAAA